MDLRIHITDENNDTLQDIQVYQDGSDSEGAQQMADLIAEHFDVDEDATMVYDWSTLKPCPDCGKPGDDMWMNDIPLRAFCWGTSTEPHSEFSQPVPMKEFDDGDS